LVAEKFEKNVQDEINKRFSVVSTKVNILALTAGVLVPRTKFVYLWIIS